MHSTQCADCGKPIGGGVKKYRFEDRELCEDCLHKTATTGNTCPCCGVAIPSDNYEVVLVLTPPGSSLLKKVRAVEVLAIVCPKCKVIFFDDFTYRTIQSLKK